MVEQADGRAAHPTAEMHRSNSRASSLASATRVNSHSNAMQWDFYSNGWAASAPSSPTQYCCCCE